VNELLDLTRIESGTLKLKIECISIQSVIEDVVSGLKALADEKGLSLSYKVPEVFPDIYLDKQRIEQVLINLVGNAIKFTKPGGRIDIFAKERDEYIEVSVRDTGRGISPVDFDRIFDKFQRLEHPLLHTTEGTGIGLPISKELVKAHHGKIWLKSQPGRGSTFTFSLPKEKRYFLIMAKEQLEIAKAEETNLCIIAMKLDDSSDWLKEEGGLQRLYEIEREMRIRVEREGAVVSYDSKEERLFVLLPRTDKVGGLAVTERLKRAGRGLGLERMETSMALYPDDAEDYDGLMRKAKEGLGMSGRQKEEGDSPGRRV
jgi:anti-sigma regulatory factor (Ser/Thr protein kinase)